VWQQLPLCRWNRTLGRDTPGRFPFAGNGCEAFPLPLPSVLQRFPSRWGLVSLKVGIWASGVSPPASETPGTGAELGGIVTVTAWCQPVLAYSCSQLMPCGDLSMPFARIPQVLYGPLARICCQIQMIYGPRNNPNRS